MKFSKSYSIVVQRSQCRMISGVAVTIAFENRQKIRWDFRWNAFPSIVHWLHHRWLRSAQTIHWRLHSSCPGSFVIWHSPNKNANRNIWICADSANNLPSIYFMSHAVRKSWPSFWITIRKHLHIMMAITWNWLDSKWLSTSNKKK